MLTHTGAVGLQGQRERSKGTIAWWLGQEGKEGKEVSLVSGLCLCTGGGELSL